jgi:hypothetical protein
MEGLIFSIGMCEQFDITNGTTYLIRLISNLP